MEVGRGSVAGQSYKAGVIFAWPQTWRYLKAVTESVFSYPHNDEDLYLSWFKDHFSSVFVATNPFLSVPGFPLTPHHEIIPDEVASAVKRQSANVGVSWKEIAELCGFPSIGYVNRALRLTGSKRILDQLSSPVDTEKMLSVCKTKKLHLPDEGYLSPLSELSLARFLNALGHTEVIAADHFGTSPRSINSEKFSLPKLVAAPEVHSRDKSIYVSIYIDYHYFLVCQTEASRLVANPADYFEGFFADAYTSDFWGIGDLN